MAKPKLDRDQLLDLIEQNGGPDGLDVSGHSLYMIDLSIEAIKDELAKRGLQASRTPWATMSIGSYSHPCAALAGIKLNHSELAFAKLGSADMYRAELAGANLPKADLQGTSLVWANVKGAVLVLASLRGADLTRANLEGAHLGDADLTRVIWFDAFLNRTRIRRSQLEPMEERVSGRTWRAFNFHHAGETYLLHRSNFVSLGRYEDASWAHIKHRQLEKASYFPTSAGHRWIRLLDRRLLRRLVARYPAPIVRWLSRLHWSYLHIRLFVGVCPRDLKDQMRGFDLKGQQPDERLDRPRWLRNWAYELLTGYGERPVLPLLWGAGLAAVFFPLLYWAIGALPGHGHAFTSSSPSDIDWAGWGDSLIFSLTSFGTLSFSRLQPEGTLPNLIAAFEAMIGVLLFALFIFTLGNRMSRS